MALPDCVTEFLERERERGGSGGTHIKRGEEIFAGTDYPREWDDFVGQRLAKTQLQVAIGSAAARGTRMEHTLLGSGIAGVGKTTLATMLAWHAGVGLVQATGPLTLDDMRALVRDMLDRDILFVDEAHLLVAGNRNRADWLLPWMLERKLYGPNGAEETPDVTLVAATTDVGKMPQTLISRFMLVPKIERYTAEEGGQIAAKLCQRLGVTGIPEDYFAPIAAASDNNPRVMRRVLTTLRDLSFAMPGTPPLDVALEWCGLSHDGLDTMAQDIMLILLASAKNTCSIESIQAQLNEPGPLRHAEQVLLQRGYVAVSGRGRQLTDAGRARAIQLVQERR